MDTLFEYRRQIPSCGGHARFYRDVPGLVEGGQPDLGLRGLSPYAGEQAVLHPVGACATIYAARARPAPGSLLVLNCAARVELDFDAAEAMP